MPDYSNGSCSAHKQMVGDYCRFGVVSHFSPTGNGEAGIIVTHFVSDSIKFSCSQSLCSTFKPFTLISK